MYLAEVHGGGGCSELEQSSVRGWAAAEPVAHAGCGSACLLWFRELQRGSRTQPRPAGCAQRACAGVYQVGALFSPWPCTVLLWPCPVWCLLIPRPAGCAQDGPSPELPCPALRSPGALPIRAQGHCHLSAAVPVTRVWWQPQCRALSPWLRVCHSPEPIGSEFLRTGRLGWAVPLRGDRSGSCRSSRWRVRTGCAWRINDLQRAVC